MELTRYLENPKILAALHKEALKGNIATLPLGALGQRMEKEGLAVGRKRAPAKHPIGERRRRRDDGGPWEKRLQNLLRCIIAVLDR